MHQLTEMRLKFVILTALTTLGGFLAGAHFPLLAVVPLTAILALPLAAVALLSALCLTRSGEQAVPHPSWRGAPARFLYRKVAAKWPCVSGCTIGATLYLWEMIALYLAGMAAWVVAILAAVFLDGAWGPLLLTVAAFAVIAGLVGCLLRYGERFPRLCVALIIAFALMILAGVLTLIWQVFANVPWPILSAIGVVLTLAIGFTWLSGIRDPRTALQRFFVARHEHCPSVSI